jgi:hippurate hydrolase
VTIGALQAGTKENVIPDEATIKLNVRTFDEGVRAHVLDSITRIVEAEAQASRAPRPPEITPLDQYQLVRNDPEAAGRVRAAFEAHFGEERVVDIPPISASEDFGAFGSEWQVPSVFWTVGGTDPDTYRQAKEAGRLSELPTNHNPRFAPVIHPTLETGVGTLLAAASSWLGGA